MLAFPHGDSQTSNSLAGFDDDCLKNSDRKPKINAAKRKYIDNRSHPCTEIHIC